MSHLLYAKKVVVCQLFIGIFCNMIFVCTVFIFFLLFVKISTSNFNLFAVVEFCKKKIRKRTFFCSDNYIFPLCHLNKIAWCKSSIVLIEFASMDISRISIEIRDGLLYFRDTNIIIIIIIIIVIIFRIDIFVQYRYENLTHR